MTLRLWVTLGVVFVTIGCDSKGPSLKVVPVTGKVNYTGKPVEGATVTFATEKSPRTAVGTTDSQGNFKLTTMNTNDGAVPGEHNVTIVKLPPPGSDQPVMKSPEDYMKHMAEQSAQGGKTAQPPSRDPNEHAIPAKYANSSTSGLKRTVVAGEKNNFTFDLTD